MSENSTTGTPSATDTGLAYGNEAQAMPETGMVESTLYDNLTPLAWSSFALFSEQASQRNSGCLSSNRS